MEKRYKRIHRMVYKYVPLMLLASLSINVLSLALPLTMRQIYGKIILNKSTETLTILVLGCIVALLLESVLKVVKERTSKWIAAKYEYQLSNYLVQKVIGGFQSSLDENSYNANVEKFNAISKVTSFYAVSVHQLFVDLPFMLLFLYLIYYLGGALIWVPLGFSCLFVVVMWVNTGLYYRAKARYMSVSDQTMDHLTETLEKIHLVKAAGLEEVQIRKYKKALTATVEAEYKANRYEMVAEMLPAYISQGVMFGILLTGGYLMLQGQITFGEITACALLGGRAVAPLMSIMGVYMHQQDIKLYRQALDQMAMIEDRSAMDLPELPEDLKGTLEFIGVPFMNINTNTLLNLSFTLPAQTFMYVDPREMPFYKVLFESVVGRTPVKEGKILVDNLDLSEWQLNALKGKIEYLSDQVGLFKGSVLDNLTHFDVGLRQQAYDAAALTGLDELVSQLPEGYETKLESQSVNYLSAAFLQRLNLTRGLLLRPRVLLIDRIDEAMDQETLEIYIWLLTKFRGQMTILVSTTHPRIQALASLRLA